MRAAIEALDHDNAAAWLFYRGLSTRFLVEAGLIPETFARRTADLDVDAFDDLVERLNRIHAALAPPKPS